MRKFLLTMVGVFLIGSIAWAQERTVSGRVTSTEDGTPLPGVNVVLKGTSSGTATDADGRYTISVPANGGALTFSFIGLESKEIEIGQRSIVDVSLALDVTQLSEVVVTALGLEVSKDKLGSATSKVTGDAAQRSGESTLINGLSGKASGVQITRTTGDPGAGSYIQIRGQSSITRSVQPLIVVDGVPISNAGGGNTASVAQQSRLNDINPNDIESMEVLKGASASALWGTRAANGVIMITTKKGASGQGKVNVSYGVTYSQDEIMRKHPLQRTWGQGISGYYYNLGGSGWALTWGDKIANRPGGADITYQPGDAGYPGYFEAEDGTEYYQIRASDFATNQYGGKLSRTTYDQYDALFQTGHFWDHNLSISGGDKKGNFFISLGDITQEGIIKGNSNYRRTSFRVNTERVMSNLIKLTSNFSYARITSDRVQQGSNLNGLFLGALRTSPDFDNTHYVGTYYDAGGGGRAYAHRSYRNPIGQRSNAGYDNPLWVSNRNLDRTEVDRFIGMMQVDVTPKDWLTVTFRGGVDHFSDKRKTFFPVGSVGFTTTSFGGGQLTLQTPRSTQFNFDTFASGAFNLSSDLTLNALVGLNFNQQTSDNVGGTTQTFIISQQVPDDLGNSTTANRNPFNDFSAIRRSAGYATANLGFKDMLFLNLSGRAERSSTFAHNDNPLFFYPSADVAFQFTKVLDIDKNILSFGKLRLGYGQVANTPGAYATFTYVNSTVYGESWGSTLNIGAYGGGYEQSSVLGNQDLKPETKTEIEFGGDFRFLNDRVSLGVTYFQNEVKDIILPVATAPSTGFTSKTGNIGALENKGIELDVSGEVVKVGDFTWNLYGNWTRIRNKVTDLAGSQSVFLAGFTGTSSRAVEGYPVGVLWGVGFDRTPEGAYVLDSNGFPLERSTEGVLGDPNPDWRAGLGSTFSWKGFSLNVLVEHSHGGQIWGGTRGATHYFGTHADTDHEVTLSAAEATTLVNWDGFTAFDYGYFPNADGTYTVRGYIDDFGGGPVLVDETWWLGLGGGFGAQAESFIESAQWTKLREVSLSYHLASEGFRNATKLTSIDFSLTGRNLAIWTDFKGNDPETNLTGPTNGRGLDYFNNPATRSFLFSIKINY